MSAPRYNEQPEKQKQDTDRVFEAFEALKRFEEQYGDLVVFPEVITILDVSDAEMSTPAGPVAAKDIYSRDELLAALEVLKASPCANIPEAIFYAVLDYRERNKPVTNNQE